MGRRERGRGRLDVVEGRPALRREGSHRSSKRGSRGAETRQVVALRALRRTPARTDRVLRPRQAVQPRGAHRARAGRTRDLRFREVDVRVRKQDESILGERRVARAIAAGFLPGPPQGRRGRRRGGGGGGGGGSQGRAGKRSREDVPEFECPVWGIRCGDAGAGEFVAIRPCGHVVSDRARRDAEATAVNAVPSGDDDDASGGGASPHCPVCDVRFDRDGCVHVNSFDVSVGERLRSSVDARRAAEEDRRTRRRARKERGERSRLGRGSSCTGV